MKSSEVKLNKFSELFKAGSQKKMSWKNDLVEVPKLQLRTIFLDV